MEARQILKDSFWNWNIIFSFSPSVLNSLFIFLWCCKYLFPVFTFLSLSLSADVLRWLAGNSSETLDIIAQYWQLLAQPNDPRSGDYGYSKEEMQKFGANEGFEVYRELENAANRNIKIRSLHFIFKHRCLKILLNAVLAWLKFVIWYILYQNEYFRA